ncbi:putative LigA [Nocardioidaceae bacterium Broad-1]|nr:putative LigA [Nocardioidaceae bacterium Broad-1]
MGIPLRGAGGGAPRTTSAPRFSGGAPALLSRTPGASTTPTSPTTAVAAASRSRARTATTASARAGRTRASSLPSAAFRRCRATRASSPRPRARAASRPSPSSTAAASRSTAATRSVVTRSAATSRRSRRSRATAAELPVQHAAGAQGRGPAARFPDGRFDPGTETGDLPRRDPGAQGGSPFGTDTGAFRTFERPAERTTPRTPPPGFGPDDDPFGPAGDAIAPMSPMAPEPTNSPNPLDSTTEVPILDDEGSSIFDDLQSEWFTRRRPLGARRAMEAKGGDPLSDPLAGPAAGPAAKAGQGPTPGDAAAPAPAADRSEAPVVQDDEPTTPVSWSSPGDEGWRRAQELEKLQEQEPATVTQGGLPVRVPGQNLIPGAAPSVTPPSSGPRNMDARRTRGMSSFQKGVSRARNNPAEAESNPEGEEQQ